MSNRASIHSILRTGPLDYWNGTLDYWNTKYLDNYATCTYLDTRVASFTSIASQRCWNIFTSHSVGTSWSNQTTPFSVALALIFMLVAQVLQWWRAGNETIVRVHDWGLMNRTLAYVYGPMYLTQWYQMVSKLSLRATFCPSCDSKFPVCIAWGQPLLDYHASLCSYVNRRPVRRKPGPSATVPSTTPLYHKDRGWDN